MRCVQSRGTVYENDLRFSLHAIIVYLSNILNISVHWYIPLDIHIRSGEVKFSLLNYVGAVGRCQSI